MKEDCPDVDCIGAWEPDFTPKICGASGDTERVKRYVVTQKRLRNGKECEVNPLDKQATVQKMSCMAGTPNSFQQLYHYSAAEERSMSLDWGAGVINRVDGGRYSAQPWKDSTGAGWDRTVYTGVTSEDKADPVNLRNEMFPEIVCQVGEKVVFKWKHQGICHDVYKFPSQGEYVGQTLNPLSISRDPIPLRPTQKKKKP